MNLEVLFEPDGDAENGLYSMNASAQVKVGAYNQEEILGIKEQKFDGCVFVPSTVNGYYVNEATELVNGKNISWLAAAVFEYFEKHEAKKEEKNLVLDVEGSMEC